MVECLPPESQRYIYKQKSQPNSLGVLQRGLYLIFLDNGTIGGVGFVVYNGFMGIYQSSQMGRNDDAYHR